MLKNIAVPTLIINSRDDPFFDHASGLSLPTAEQLGDAPILMHVTEHGGHCGFLDKQGFHKQAPCYFQREFARFFVHMRDSTLHQDTTAQDRESAAFVQGDDSARSTALEVSEDTSTV